MRQVFLASLLPIVLFGCSSSTSSGTPVSKQEMGDKWPLTVESGEVHCDGDKQTASLTFTHNGKKYAINGTAMTLKDGAEIREIWADNPKRPGLKKDIGPLMDKARGACP